MATDKRRAGGLRDVLTRDALAEYADERSFDRGEGYLHEGRVHSSVEVGNVLSAKVRGTRDYRVKLWVEGDDLGYSCTCPWAAEGNFCKHCVAVGLAWLREEGGAPESETGRRTAKPTVTMDDVRALLEQEDKGALVDMVMAQITEDDDLRERLLLRAARRTTKGLDAGAFSQALSDAIEHGEFVEWDGVHDYARRVNKVVDSVQELLDEGFAREVIELAEHGLRLIEQALGQVDDSDGEVGSIAARLQETHLAACQKAKPDPEDLARRLFEWELRSDWEVFSGAAASYRDVLGEKGLAAYRQLAEERWSKIPALGPNDEKKSWEHDRYAITHVMETLAGLSGDIEEQVRIKTRDLSSAYQFLRIAEIYRGARNRDKALEWAERGVKAFPTGTDSRLREFLADEYHRQKRHDEAMALIWAEFSEGPDLEHYKLLKAHADRIGQWPAWREKALDAIRKSISDLKRGRAKDRWLGYGRVDNSQLVEVFLWEGENEAAWKEATAGGCADPLWLKLAARREKEHPEDAIAVYRKRIEPIIDRKNNPAYEEAVRLLRKVASLMKRLAREQEFAEYLAAIRLKHKPKRNFIKLLDRV